VGLTTVRAKGIAGQASRPERPGCHPPPPYFGNDTRACRVTTATLAVLVASGSFCAGTLGALTGIGGGIVIVPMLTLLFHVELRYAIGASLVSVIATSSGAAAAYVREGFTNVRIGILLEVATTSGAVLGAFAAGLVSKNAIGVLFGFVLLF